LLRRIVRSHARSRALLVGARRHMNKRCIE
jgi:hypothetical protein